MNTEQKQILLRKKGKKSSSGLADSSDSLLDLLCNVVGDDIAGLISDAFEKHLPDPSVLVEPAQIYADTLTKATIEKLTPLTNIVKESVEGVSEARLSLQEQTETIRNAMNLLAGEMSDLLAGGIGGIPSPVTSSSCG